MTARFGESVSQFPGTHVTVATIFHPIPYGKRGGRAYASVVKLGVSG
jgi:hypothetical protein